MRILQSIFVALLLSVPVWAQESVDHSNAASVVPFPVRNSSPGSCRQGAYITRSDGTTGSNTYVCGSSNNWVLVGTGVGATIPSITNVLCGSGTGNGADCGFAPTVVTKTIASGATALGTSAISSATCATVVTAAATGTLTTDVMTAGFNGDPTAVTGYIPSTSGMLTIIPYPTAGNVNFKVCNNTSASITPGAITLNWRVAR